VFSHQKKNEKKKDELTDRQQIWFTGTLYLKTVPIETHSTDFGGNKKAILTDSRHHQCGLFEKKLTTGSLLNFPAFCERG
jgi:hypothetical protein